MSGEWDALVTSPIAELNAEPGDIIIVRPKHPEFPVMILKRYGPDSLALVEEHRDCLGSRREDSGECPTPQAKEVAS